MDNTKDNRPSYLKVKLGDVVMVKKTKRVGYVHDMGRTFGKNSFSVTWYDDPKNKTLFSSRRTQQELEKTGENVYEDSDEEN